MTPTSIIDNSATRSRTVFLVLLIAVTALRVGLLLISDVNIGPDESQYWFWSLTPDFGYFSKPPLIAWAIGLTTTAFGDAPWAVRLAAPLFHSATALCLFALGKELQHGPLGFWAGTGWLLMPAVGFSSALITTDVPLLFFWSASLLFFVRLMKASQAEQIPQFIDAISLGICLGLGFLSKYAMIYFIVALVPALFISPALRRTTMIRSLLFSLIVMAIIIAPNIWWNVQNDLQTVSHTVANANWQGPLFHPIELLEFILAQFGMVGPIIVAVFLASLFLTTPSHHDKIWQENRRVLLLFALTPLIIVSIQAFVSRAHANWAAASYPVITLLAIAFMLNAKRFRLLLASHGIHLALAFVLSISLSNFWLVDAAGFSNAVKRVRGWPEQGAQVAAIAKDFPTVMVDDRELMGQVLYHGGQARGPVIAWNSNNKIDDHYEAFLPFKHGTPEPIFYITKNPDAVAVRHLFDDVTLIGQSSVDLKRNRSRVLYFYKLSEFKGAPD